MADVIDDEELIATRRLNGVDDNLYKEEKEAILKRKAKELDDFGGLLRPKTILIKKLVENTRKRGADGKLD